MKQSAPPFYGWRIVKAALIIAFVSWSFALYGTSVYVTALSEQRGWSIGVISTALTGSFLINAFSIGWVGALIGRHGPRLVMTVGAFLAAAGIAGLGQATVIWQMALAFALMGLGWSCLSTIAISATVAPWFERQQGKAISIALLGASLGGMFGVPISLLLVENFGVSLALTIIGSVFLVTIVPISLLVLRRSPQDMGLWPDGAEPEQSKSSHTTRSWTRREALQTYELRSTIIAFGFALMVQIGFLSQQVKLLQSSISATGTGLTVLVSGSLAFIGRVVLARIADRINIRMAAAVVLWLSAFGLAVTAFAQSAAWLVIGVLLFGINVGNLTTLPALIVRREFGAVSFGKIFGITGTFMQLVTAAGPALFGILHDSTGSYEMPLYLASGLMIACSFVIAYRQWPWLKIQNKTKQSH